MPIELLVGGYKTTPSPVKASIMTLVDWGRGPGSLSLSLMSLYPRDYLRGWVGRGKLNQGNEVGDWRRLSKLWTVESCFGRFGWLDDRLRVSLR